MIINDYDHEWTMVDDTADDDDDDDDDDFDDGGWLNRDCEGVTNHRHS